MNSVRSVPLDDDIDNDIDNDIDSLQGSYADDSFSHGNSYTVCPCYNGRVKQGFRYSETTKI